MSTIRELAKMAGVSVGTVSRVLNDAENVDPIIRERTLSVIRKSGYSLRPRGRRSSTKTATTKVESKAAKVKRTVLAFAPEMTSSWISHELWQEYLTGIKKACAGRGCSSMVCMADSLHQLELICKSSRDTIAGVMVKTGDFESDGLPRLTSLVPTVGFGSYRPDLSIPQVAVDDVGAGSIATQALLDLGHQRIAFVNPEKTRTRFIARYQGYSSAMRAAGIYDPSLLIEMDVKSSSRIPQTMLPDLTAVIKMLMASGATAVVLANDWNALGLYKACAEAGIRIPEDLSIVGVDDSIEAKTAKPALSSVSLAFDDVSYFAANMLLDMVDGAGQYLRGKTSVHYVPVVFQKRASVAAPASILTTL